MRIPKFWEVAEGSEIGPRGERLFRRVWGWSTSSSAEAFAVAQERLRTTLANIRSGARPDTYYPRTPLREPILAERVVDGEVLFAVTRNRYGAEVLNTERVLIADVDLPELDIARRRTAAAPVPAHPGGHGSRGRAGTRCRAAGRNCALGQRASKFRRDRLPHRLRPPRVRHRSSGCRDVGGW